VRRQCRHSIALTAKIFKTDGLWVEMAVLAAVRAKVVIAKSLWITNSF
jgi:hypothetical protein